MYSLKYGLCVVKLCDVMCDSVVLMGTLLRTICFVTHTVVMYVRHCYVTHGLLVVVHVDTVGVLGPLFGGLHESDLVVALHFTGEHGQLLQSCVRLGLLLESEAESEL